MPPPPLKNKKILDIHPPTKPTVPWQFLLYTLITDVLKCRRLHRPFLRRIFSSCVLGEALYFSIFPSATGIIQALPPI